MRLHLTLRAQKRCAYEPQYHRGIMGRITDALADSTLYSELREARESTFVFSEPIPYVPEYDTGDTCSLVIASPHDELLSHITSDLQQTPEITAGSFVLEAVKGEGRDPDVGPPGTTGCLETLSAVSYPPEQFGDIDQFTGTDEQVRRFREYVGRTAYGHMVKDGTIEPRDEHVPNPFVGYDHIETFAVPVVVTEGTTNIVVAGKWRFDYEVRDEEHRRMLNYLLDAGLGARGAYGFGCLAPLGTMTSLAVQHDDNDSRERVRADA